jgi:hypothetical protein
MRAALQVSALTAEFMRMVMGCTVDDTAKDDLDISYCANAYKTKHRMMRMR